MKKKITLLLIVVSLILFSFALPNAKLKENYFNKIQAHDVNTGFNAVTPTNYVSYTEVRTKLNNLSELQTLINGKVIMFNSAQELHDWSQDLRYVSNVPLNVKTILATSDYTLGADIDYSVMKANRFMPIGYRFSEGGSEKSLVFSGTFDGRGFEINELELEIYSNFSFEDEQTNIVYVYNTFYSMFTENSGTIKDLGLIDPIIELTNEHVTLRDFSYLVGKNTGTVKDSYVIDSRNYPQAGMRISAMKTEAANQKRAAGLVHTNTGDGVVENSFFSGVSVVNSEFMHVVLEEPTYFIDSSSGISSSVVYNSTRYGQGVPSNLYVEPDNGTPNTESNIKNNSNDLNSGWYYYPSEDGTDSYPKRFGLSDDGSKYQITNARDLITFSKLLGFSTGGLNGLGYNEQTYYITNDINMEDVSYEAYKLSEHEFLGTLTANETTQTQISNFFMDEGINIEDGYHLGMFYLLGGTVENIKLYNITIKPSTTTNYTGQVFYVGSVAAKLNGGTIKNVTIQSDIDFTSTGFKVGAYSVGAVAGIASGTIEKIYISDESEIHFGEMQYVSTDRLTPNFYLGGAIGRTGDTKLNMYNVLNEGNISNFETTQLYINNNAAAYFHIGGVIGHVNNTNTVRHNIGLITNTGEITTRNFTSTSSITTYLGGVIGLSDGFMYDFTNTYGGFGNSGEFVYNNNANKTLYVAGVLNSNHGEAVEFIQIVNDNAIQVTQNNVYGSALVNHISNKKLTISQARSSGSITYSGTQRQDIHGAVYTSSKTTELQLNFVDVKTGLIVNYVDNLEHLNIAGVTLNENANYLNVTYGGLLQVEVTGNNTSVIWVSGITKELSNNKIMKNSMNEGTMHVYAKTTNTTNSTVKNLYVGGLVNINESGDLHTQSGSMPTATKGIINSINRADITSYFGTRKGIEGRINTFAGGIATINRGSIQDVVNTGDIRFANVTSGSQDDFVDIDGSENQGGKTNMYKTGVVIGGITSVVTIGNSRIYDSINNGNITAQSYYYARSGGILGVVSPFDVSAGDVHNYTENNNAADPNHLKHSVISNGINYGNVYAITSVIGEYATGNLGTSANLYQNLSGNYTWPTQTSPSINMQTRNGSSGRIAIHSAAGGITGSGLSVLKRMINHGQIGATDAAGGIIGSVYVYADQSWRSAGRGTTAVGVTIVNINTAINYGDIRAIMRHSGSSTTNNTHFNEIYNQTGNVVSEIQGRLFGYNDDFINPTNPRNTAHANSIRLFPEHKRGIGGIMGRIQRGGNQNMITNYDGVEFYYGPDLTSEEGSFDFIVNMNPNVDLIGRLDQNYNFSLSATAFHFHDAIYYSAKQNDTTQAVFTGFLINQSMTGYYVQGPNANVTESSSGWIRPTYTYNVTGSQVTYQNASYNGSFLQKGQVMKEDIPGSLNYSQVYSNNSSFSIDAGRNQWTIHDVPGGKFIATSGGRTFGNAKPVPFITETPSGNSEEYVYHEEFVMRDEDTTLTTGESISEYIYYAAVDLLADRFQSTRPNGMYVLSTTAGSTFGSVLPRNFNVNKLSKIINGAPNNLDYENVDEDYLDMEEASFTDLLTTYKEDLYQTKLNDKSALLEDDQYFTVKDPILGTLVNDGSGDIDYDNKRVGIIIDRLILGTATELDLEILQALLPENALIARPKRSNETVEDFQALLQTFKEANPNAIVATGDLAPTLYISGSAANNVDYDVGTFISYSEAAVMDSNFTGNSNYYTEYTLYIRIVQENQNNPPYLYEVSRDGGTFNNSFNNVTITDYLTMRFRDQYGILANGHIVDEYISVYYKDSNDILHLVNPLYYSINSVPKTSEHFDTTITFNNLLRNGTYVVKYKIYANQTEQELTINYNHERTHEIYEFRPYTSTFYDGLNADFAFGHELDFTTPFIEHTNGEVYLARHTYTIPFLQTFSASSFFEIASISVGDITGTNDYKKYEVTFNLKDGSQVVRYIEESSLSPTYYKNNVKISSSTGQGLLPNYADNFVTREAERTTFSLVYNMKSDLYDVNNFTITLDGTTPVTTSSEGVYYNISNNRLNIIFDDSLLPGDYEVNVLYAKDGANIPAGNLVINKQTGTRAYLENIKFSEFVPGIEYPEIYAVNSLNNNIIDTLGIYYRGIDYQDKDTQSHKYFRIDGEVAGIPLNEYMPLNIIDYLPLGGSIQRKYYVNGVATWSDLVNAQSTLEDIIESLSADFTVDPATGNLEFDGEGNAILPYIEYRVVSEEDVYENTPQNGVTYFMSVRDIEYSFLAVFTYMYFDGTNYYPIDTVEEADGKLLILSINNYEVKKDGILQDDSTTDDYPEFDEVVKIKSTITQFYQVVYNVTNNQYVYGLGNNFSGYYHFNLDTDYEYYIREGTTEGDDLPMMSTNIEGEEGYYYYINASPVTRTRYFSVIITGNRQTKDTWGLTDYNNTKGN